MSAALTRQTRINPTAIHILTHNARRLLIWGCLFAMSRLYGQAPILKQTVNPLIVDGHFTSTMVNDRVWLCREPQPSPQTLPTNWAGGLTGFRPNADSQIVQIGPAYDYPQAWVYLPLVNPTDYSRNMVVDLDHNRCDTLDAFLVRENRREPVPLGRLFRGLPLAQRPIPRRHYALPFTLMPYDSAGLLLCSRRITGIHELVISVSTEPQFTIKQDQEDIVRLFAMASACFFMLTVFSIGLTFHHRLLVQFGVYMIALVLGQLNFNFFLDAFPFPAWLGLNANSVGLFIIFGANALFHTFGVAYLDNLGLNRRGDRWAVGLLVTANLLAMGIMLFPLTPFTNRLVTQASLVLATLQIGWLFYISILGFRVKREKYLLITTTLVFIPLLYKTYGQSTPALNYTFFSPFYYLLLFSFLTTSLFRRELNSRHMTQIQVRRVQAELESLRKTEIEQIGRNLHDQLGNTLASVLGYLTLNVPKVDLAKKMLLEAINETRMISHHLVKDDDRPLTEKLAELTERFNDSSAICFAYHDFSEQQLDQLTPLKRQGIYMIVQEALHNIVRHAQAQEAIIQTFLTQRMIRLSVEDDGIGYVASKETSGIGLANMHKRAELAGLTLTIDSGMGGTLVTIETSLAD